MYLRPCLKVNALFHYCLAYAAQRHGVQLHAAVAMSDHQHTTLTDPTASLADFSQDFHGWTGRGINSLLTYPNTQVRKKGCLWDGSTSYNAVLLGVKGELEPLEYCEDVLARMVYCAVNPVRAGLVKTHRDWPGFNSAQFKIGQELVVPRPSFFFRANGPMPDEVRHRFERPAGFDRLTDREFDQLYHELIHEAERDVRREHRAANKRFLGPARVLKVSAWSTARSPEPIFTRDPKVASKSPQRRRKMLDNIRAFRAAYRDALAALLDGQRDVVFPYGTLQRVRYAGVLCAQPDAFSTGANLPRGPD